MAAQRKELDAAAALETSITFSGQFFQYCFNKRIHALFTSRCPRGDSLETHWVRLINVPRTWEDAGGWRYHCGLLLYAMRLARMAKAFRADLAIIDSGTTHYFALALFRILGIRVAVNFHNVRWPNGFPPRTPLGRIIRALDSWTFRHIVVGTLGCSPECGIQARADGADRLIYFEWCAQYVRDSLKPCQPPAAHVPFRVLFAGRIEASKGVFDLIQISASLKRRCRVPVVIDICGEGSALPALRAALASSNECDRVAIRGKMTRDELFQAYEKCHAVIVPTRSSFCEGMPLVCAEAVLSGRPVITSRLSNALPVIGCAVAEAMPDDVESYVDAISMLAENPQKYERLRLACSTIVGKFQDPARSYTAAIDRLITMLHLSDSAVAQHDSTDMTV